MIDKLELYYRLPHPARSLVASIHGYRLNRLRYTKDTPAQVERALGRESWDWERWQQ